MSLIQLLTGVTHRSAAFAYRGGSFFDKRDFSMIAVLVKHPKGDLLIDAGFGRDVKTHFKTMPFYFTASTNFDPGRSVADQFTDAGYNQKSLRAIILTHSHWDHVSGVSDFKQTPVCVTTEEHRFINDGNKLSALIRSFPNVKYEEYSFE